MVLENQKEEKRKMKRFLAGFLCLCMILTSDVFYSQAAAVTDTQNEGNETESVEEQKEQQELLNYAVIGSPYISTPGTQKVLLSIGEADTVINKAVLTYVNTETGAEYQTEAQQISADGIVFSMDFNDPALKGIYRLEKVEYQIGEEQKELVFSDAGMEMLFGVETAVDTKPDSVVVEEEESEEENTQPDVDVVVIDPQGTSESVNGIQEAIQNAATDTDQNISESEIAAFGAKQIVVVLDPGHDASHGGTSGNGLLEKNLNLKIAQFCKKELEKYSGVKVYMTRTGDACPNGGSAVSAGICNQKRVDYAASVGANVYVSIHNNAGGGNGAEVYYPNANYRPDLSTTGQGLAQKIIDQLVALGLKNRGIKIRNSASGDSYNDGTLMDYYGVIRRSKNNYNIPAIIVEHAFVDSSDAASFLNSDTKLKKLGVADATGIAQYFGLTKKDSNVETKENQPAGPLQRVEILYAKSRTAGGVTVKWNKVQGATKYKVVRRKAGESSFRQIATVGDKDYFIDQSVKTGKTYYYKVKAVNSNGGGSYSAEIKGIAFGKPQIKYVKSVSEGKLKVSWNAVKGAQYYQVYRSTSKNGSYKKITETKSTYYTNGGRTPGKVYYYKIRAVRKAGNGVYSYSPYSEWKSARNLCTPLISDISTKRKKQLQIRWSGVKDASFYQLYRSEQQNGSYTYVATVKKTNYADNVPTTGKYYYKVRVVNKNGSVKGYSSYSPAVSNLPLGKVTISSASSYSSEKIQLSWGAVEGSTKYQIYRSTSSKDGYKKVAEVSATNYIDKKRQEGITYYYKIRATNQLKGKKGYGAFSKAKSCKTLAKPEITAARSLTSTSAEIQWGAVSGADGYRIYRSTDNGGSFQEVAAISDTIYKDTDCIGGKTYTYKIRAVKGSGATMGKGSQGSAVPVNVLERVNGVGAIVQSDGTIQVSWNAVSGAGSYQVARSTAKNGTYKIIKNVNATKVNDNSVESAGATFYYKVRAVKDINGVRGYGTYSEPVETVTGYSIMGASKVNLAQMTNYYKSSGKKYPSTSYSQKGAANIEAFCNIVLEEAHAEGIRAEVLFAQICLETGFLQFGGDVKPEQCNFGGLGATGNGVAGNTYPDVRTGIRAQVQHLKAYACTEPLNQTCVDDRFKYVSRGCAPYVQWLGIPDNPSGKGWAAAKGYGYNLMRMIANMTSL